MLFSWSIGLVEDSASFLPPGCSAGRFPKIGTTPLWAMTIRSRAKYANTIAEEQLATKLHGISCLQSKTDFLTI